MLHTLAVAAWLLPGRESPHSCMDTDLGIVGDIHGGASWRVYTSSSSHRYLYITLSALAPIADHR
jgi:hypothetical protein